MEKREQAFEVLEFRVKAEGDKRNAHVSEATVKIKIKDHGDNHIVAEGNGPVNALDNAMRKALDRYYPGLEKVVVVDYHVGIVSSHKGTASSVKVWIEFSLGDQTWEANGVSTNIVHASLQALEKGLNRAISEFLTANPTA